MSQKKRVFTVLCIDGGGVRGIIPARILQEIEEKTGKPVSELFDLIGGPSTGAIVAAGLTARDPVNPSKPKYTAEQMKNFYYKHAPRIFPPLRFKNLRQLRSAMYDPKPLEEALETAFGDMRLKDALTHLMLPAIDIKNFRPVWLNSFKDREDNSPEGWTSMLLREAVRACTTAPTYFPARYYITTPNEDMPNVTHRHALIDGGFLAGNTLHYLLSKARRLAPPDAEIVFVHVGTGHNGNSLSPEEYNRLGALGLMSKSHGSVLMSLVVNMAEIDAANCLREEMGDNFVSFDGAIPREPGQKNPTASMDNAEEENLKRLEKFAEGILAEGKDDLDRLCDMLIARSEMESDYQQSGKALQGLCEYLQQAKNAKALTALYHRMQDMANGIDDGKADADDPLIKPLAESLNDGDRRALATFYKSQLEKFDKDSPLRRKLRDMGEEISGMFNKATKRRKKDAPPEANDNPKPADKKKKRGNNNKPPQP